VPLKSFDFDQLFHVPYFLAKEWEKKPLTVMWYSLYRYETLLEETPEFLPAMYAAARAWFSIAREEIIDGFVGPAVQSISQALTRVGQALDMSPRFACMWKLAGDTCQLAQHLPHSSVVSIQLPEPIESALLDAVEVGGPEETQTFNSLILRGATASYVVPAKYTRAFAISHCIWSFYGTLLRTKLTASALY
jgi:hypothetical protein